MNIKEYHFPSATGECEIYGNVYTPDDSQVDAVLALDGKGRQGAKPQFGIQVLGLGIVMQHRQVEIAQAAAHKVLDQMPHQLFTHSRA